MRLTERSRRQSSALSERQLKALRMIADPSSWRAKSTNGFGYTTRIFSITKDERRWLYHDPQRRTMRSLRERGLIEEYECTWICGREYFVGWQATIEGKRAARQ